MSSSLRTELANALNVDLQFVENQFERQVCKQAFFQALAAEGIAPSSDVQADEMFEAALSLQQHLAPLRQQEQAKQAALDPVNVAIGLLRGNAKQATAPTQGGQLEQSIVESFMSSPEWFAYGLTAATTE